MCTYARMGPDLHIGAGWRRPVDGAAGLMCTSARIVAGLHIGVWWTVHPGHDVHVDPDEARPAHWRVALRLGTQRLLAFPGRARGPSLVLEEELGGGLTDRQ